MLLIEFFSKTFRMLLQPQASYNEIITFDKITHTKVMTSGKNTEPIFNLRFYQKKKKNFQLYNYQKTPHKIKTKPDHGNRNGFSSA